MDEKDLVSTAPIRDPYNLTGFEIPEVPYPENEAALFHDDIDEESGEAEELPIPKSHQLDTPVLTAFLVFIGIVLYMLAFNVGNLRGQSRDPLPLSR